MRNSYKKKTERRAFPRVMAPVLYRELRMPGAKRRVSNLSLGGVRIYNDERLEAGGRLKLEFFLPDGSTVEGIAEVAWIIKMPEGAEALYDVGMEFVELSEAAMEKLKDVISCISL